MEYEYELEWIVKDNLYYNITSGFNISLSTDETEQVLQPRISLDLIRFNRWYQSIHGYLSIVVCSFGILSNVFNIVVLTRRSMLTPTNFLLTGIAVSDMLKMTSYWPFAAYFYCYSVMDANYNHPRGWIIYMVFNMNFVITCHTIAMWLTVALAVFRYVAVCKPQIGKTFCTLHRARIVLFCITIATVVACLPLYVIYRPANVTSDVTSHADHTSSTIPVSSQETTSYAQSLAAYTPHVLHICGPVFYSISCVSTTTSNQTLKSFLRSNLHFNVTSTNFPSTYPSVSHSLIEQPIAQGYWVEQNAFINQHYVSFQFWLYGVVLKVAPCVLLSIISLKLLQALREAEQKRKLLRRRRSSLRRRESDRMLDGDHNRTTAMLVAVVLSFVATELPHGIIALLSGINNDIFEKVYVPLGDVWDILVLLNSAINFVLYCIMSRQYRQTFEKVFLSRWKRVQAAYRNSAVEELAVQVGVGKNYSVTMLAKRSSVRRIESIENGKIVPQDIRMQIAR